jgi:hypothetical protein
MFKNFLPLFLSFFIIGNVHTKKIIIPFKTTHNIAINYMQSLLYNQIYATLEIGTNKQVAYIAISTAETYFAMESANINRFSYNYNKSDSYKNNGGMFIYSEREQRYMQGDVLNDTFHFYDSLDSKKEDIKAYNDLMFAYISKLGRYCYPEDNGYIDNNQTLISGTIGLQITVYYNDYDQINILKSLKNLNLIDKLVWNINYTNNEEGYLIIGEHPHQYNASYSEDKRKSTACTTPSDRDFSWTFSFTDIKSGDNKLNSYRYADYAPQYGLIIGTSEYKTLIAPYFDSLQKCESKELTHKQATYSYYECNIDVNINNFEPLTFIHSELGQKFILDKDDLFKDYNGKKYCLVVFQKESNTQMWALGTPFVKKYPFTFDHDSRNIFYYELGNENEKEGTPTSKIILICVCVVLGIGAVILGIVLGKVFVANRKKKKAKELVEEINNNDENENNDEYNKLGV